MEQTICEPRSIVMLASCVRLIPRTVGASDILVLLSSVMRRLASAKQKDRSGFPAMPPFGACRRKLRRRAAALVECSAAESHVARVIHHPAYAESVDAAAVLLGPFRSLQRHLDGAAGREAVEYPLGRVRTFRRQRDVAVAAGDERLALRRRDVARHQHRLPESERDMGYAVELAFRNARGVAAEVPEAEHHLELAAEDALVEVESLFGVTVEVKVGVSCFHACTPYAHGRERPIPP